ncbi:MAG: 4-(cytidine 5'-diphospho)-2-C-methyl-D-erythritol kinase [Chitinivibrionales bacterium]|nr:4-(cytidine 5'-diphospho)-2-C-methyl-D-erythritol kinase [Chitinivibrionales bacterium]
MLTQQSFSRLTLSLDIVKRISGGLLDGYHELAIVKHEIDLCDTLTIENAPAIEVECNIAAVPRDRRNLCWQAIELVRSECAIKQCARVTLQKKIPVMGGLAGGSSNAAATLELCNRLWRLGLTRDKLCELGRKLGMDVPYYFFGNTVLDTEAGGTIRPVETNIALDFILVLPSFGVETREAYARLDYSKLNSHAARTGSMLDAFVRNDARGVIKEIHNDFEASVFAEHPRLRTIKQTLLELGCLNAGMSGSGSTIFGIAKSRRHAQEIQRRLEFISLVAASKLAS